MAINVVMLVDHLCTDEDPVRVAVYVDTVIPIEERALPVLVEKAVKAVLDIVVKFFEGEFSQGLTIERTVPNLQDSELAPIPAG